MIDLKPAWELRAGAAGEKPATLMARLSVAKWYGPSQCGLAHKLTAWLIAA